MAKLRVLVTGGPTRAYLDRVRFISNVSTGALGFELCRELGRRNIEVIAVMGPNSQPWKTLRIKRMHQVETNDEMLAAVMHECRVFRPSWAVFSAAVLDFVPVRLRPGKVASRTGRWTVQLKASPKIIDCVGHQFPSIKRVGFKLEWNVASARQAKFYGERVLQAKGYEALCLNYLSQIRPKTHPALLLSSTGAKASVTSKREIAKWIADLIAGA